MKKLFGIANICYLLVVCALANCFVLVRVYPIALALLVPPFLLINVLGGTKSHKTARLRLRICWHGAVLLGLFVASLVVSVAWHVVLAVHTLPNDYMTLIFSALICIGVEAIVFWNGIICVYVTSTQMGVKWRVIGALCGFIPVVNLIVLGKILSTVIREVELEVGKEQINAARREARVCATRYPILLVHGVFFRDSKFFNYWGRIPAELEANGAHIFYGEHPSALSVSDSARALADRIRSIVEQTGCGKVNLIAHSKGGLDCRYALSMPEVADRVASLTTINTPHRGCLFAERLLNGAPESLKERVAATYNATLSRLGDKNPDFLAAVRDLTGQRCRELDAALIPPEGIFCQSVGSRLNRATSGKFPLNLSYHLVKRFDGENDGLVGTDSFAFGECCRMVTVRGRRGVSHGDMIDLNRENIAEFDVREFYVDLVQDLKRRGL